MRRTPPTCTQPTGPHMYHSMTAARIVSDALQTGLARRRPDGGVEWMPGFIPMEFLLHETARRLGARPPEWTDLSSKDGNPIDPFAAGGGAT